MAAGAYKAIRYWQLEQKYLDVFLIKNYPSKSELTKEKVERFAFSNVDMEELAVTGET